MPPEEDREPTRAQKARSLVEARGFGALATVSRRKPGHPFASVVKYGTGREGRPLLLLSALAVHTKNILADPRASLMVFEETAADPLASARVTLAGEVRPVDDTELAGLRARYIERHPEAARYFEFGDFSLYRLAVDEAYYVGGFGEMGWISGPDYGAAQ
jgi:heme iron utilization protein